MYMYILVVTIKLQWSNRWGVIPKGMLPGSPCMSSF